MREDNPYFALAANLCYRGGLAVHARLSPSGNCTTWHFANGTPFGVVQYHGLFEEPAEGGGCALADVEAEVEAHAGNVRRLESMRKPTVDASVSSF